MTDTRYDKYKEDFFRKLNISFKKGKKILDVGCGDGGDAKIFLDDFQLKTFAIDIFRHKEISKNKRIKFTISSIFKIPFKSNTFDYVYLHDVLHHIDEEKQSFAEHKKGLLELKRVCKKNGEIIIIEANRFNPLFYPHMVLINKHNHFTQEYFKKLIRSVFKHSEIRHFECHVYPDRFKILWRFYETIMEAFSPKAFLAYNIALIHNRK